MNRPAEVQLPSPHTGKPEIGMAALVDVVFLLLIFFMVTTVFPEHRGLAIEKPVAEHGASLDRDALEIALDQHGGLFFQSQPVTADQLLQQLRVRLQQRPDAVVLIRADRRATTQDLIRVIDISKNSGAGRVGIATDEKLPAS
jgi:biopolymer transport protein ExbD